MACGVCSEPRASAQHQRPPLRDGKTYKRASNACVSFFLGWVKSVPNFRLFCCESELCRDFGFLGVIFMAVKFVNFLILLLKEEQL